MQNQTLSFMVLLVTGFMLVLVASYLSHFQSWLTFTQPTSKVFLEQPVSYSGIRSITSFSGTDVRETPSNQGRLKTGSESLEHFSVVPLSVKKPAPQSSETQGSKHESPPVTALEEMSSIDFPIFVEYENELLLEFPASFSSKLNVKRAINRVLLSATEVDQADLVSLTSIQSKIRPFYYKKIQNQYGRPIRYPAAASQYADYLLKNHSEEIIDGSLKYLVVHIPLV
ncbi:MAG: DUF3393 domain-containing protein, partial [Gammaproteobacteria bacterium]|nr:DUF3393 domain-containing protein [Gammaproteobacteria bacterium]